MDSRNLDHINYSYTDSERAKRNALKKRRRKQLLIQSNVTKLRLLYDKNIIKKVGEIVSSAFFAFQGQHK